MVTSYSLDSWAVGSSEGSPAGIGKHFSKLLELKLDDFKFLLDISGELMLRRDNLIILCIFGKCNGG